MENIDLWKKGYLARKRERERRINRAFIKDYLKALGIGLIALPILWLLAVGILSI